MRHGERYRVGILGATGLVGQRLVRLLDGHPWLELVAVAASERSAGRPYADATRWSLVEPMPGSAAELPVRRCSPRDLAECDAVFSALDAEPAQGIEAEFRDAGCAVISNSSAYRMDPQVPLLVPEVNSGHVGAIERQRDAHRGGFIVTNPNCSVTGLVIALAPLHRAFGIRRLVVTTLQAVSGAGIDGPRVLHLLDNVVPFIPGEEEKIEREANKILGTLEAEGIKPAPFGISAHCHRVMTLDGHLEAVSIELGTPVGPEGAEQALREFAGDVHALGLPSAPARPIELRAEPDRPQPRLDRDSGGGMTVVVGRVRACPVLGLKFELLSHNTVRGAAGGTLLNAELLAARGCIPRRATV